MRDIGIDLGTTNILIYVKGKGIVLDEPSVVSYDTEKNKIIAIGREAKEMIGKEPEAIKVIKPMQDGVIADFEMTEEMLRSFIKKALGRKTLTKHRILICCPSNITGVEKNAIREIAERIGSKKVYIEEEPKVAAVGAGIDITKPSGSMIVDIGGGTTDIAVLSLGGIVTSTSLKIAGNTFDEDIINYIKEKYKIIIGEQTAEDLKISIKTALDQEKVKEKEVTGRAVSSGLPTTVVVKTEDIDNALKDDLNKIITEIKNTLEKTPPELAKDIKEKGLILTGGGSLLDGLVEILRKELKIPVFLSDNPLTNVVEGTKVLLDNIYIIDN